MSGRLIFVTGATGFVGRALVDALLREGVAPDCLRLAVRDISRAEKLGLPRESLRAAELGDRQGLAEALVGADIAIHVAGAIKALSRRGFDVVNADGTAHVVEALDAHAPGARLIHVSSLAAAGPSRDGSTSALPPERCQPRSAYGQSKRAGEQHVVAMGDRRPWVIVRPPIVYGPRDAATRLLFRQALAPVAPVPWQPRPLSLVHIDDLVRALLVAAFGDATGVVLPVDGPDRLDTDRLVLDLAAACGRTARLVRVPTPVLWPVGLACDAWAQVTRRAQIMGRDKVRDLSAPGWIADPEPAKRALGFEARVRSAEGFRATAEAEGFVSAGG